MAKLYHYSNEFAVEDSVLQHQMLEKFASSNTDITGWRPEISVSRAQQGISSGKRLVYDFDDGKDTGEYVMTYIRQQGLDVTEVDALLDSLKAHYQDKIDSAKSKEERDRLDKALNDNIQSIRDSLAGKAPDASSSDSSADGASGES